MSIATRAGGRADRMLDAAQTRVFRFLWFFLPEPSVARDLRFQHLMVSRFLTEAAQQSLTFGSLVAVAREGSALEVALVGVAGLVPPALLGMYGGAVADELPKRIALAGVYVGEAALCFTLPALFGTGLPVVLLLLFGTSTLSQVSGPTESSVLPLVASEEQLASGASMISLAAAAGGGFGTALFAPVLVRTFGVRPVMYLAGVLFLLAATRVFNLALGGGERRHHFWMPRTRIRGVLRWLARHPAVGTMVIVSVLAGTVNIVLVTLAPKYVESVLHTDAANTAYVFAPTALGIVIALVSAPFLLGRFGERVSALAGLLLGALCLFLLGLPGQVASVTDAVNPLRLTQLFGLDMNERVRAAGLLALPLAFGVSLANTAVQTYINRRVPLGYQGRMFAMQGSLRNGSAIVPLLTLGAAAAAIGAQNILLASPLLLLAIGYALVMLSYRFSPAGGPSPLHVVESFWEEPVGAATGGTKEETT